MGTWENLFEEMQKMFTSNTTNGEQFFDSFNQMYKNFRTQVETFVMNMEKSEQNERTAFFIKQFLDFYAPQNIPWLNREVIEKTLETKGDNLLKGFANFIRDLEQKSVSFSDKNAFCVGKNIASTSGSIVFQTPLFELISYKTKRKVNLTPILITPSWVNKFYIVDLTCENSFVKWLIDQNFAVYVISWVNPEAKNNFELKDYILSINEAANFIIKQTGVKNLHGVGYCFGGNALLAAASLEKKFWKSITLLATLIDFEMIGDLKAFISNEYFKTLEQIFAEQEYIDGRTIQLTFQMLRSNDLLATTMINNYWLGKNQKALDFLYWNDDAMNIAYKTHIEALKSWCWKNELFLEKFKVGRKKIKLADIQIPTLIVGTRKDHITPWIGCFQGIKKLQNSEFILAESGHIAGIINAPIHKKYGYFYNLEKIDCYQKWEESAIFQKGSWWPYLANWLKNHDLQNNQNELNLQKKKLINKKSDVQKIDSHTFTYKICKAPGKYVLKRI